MIKTVETVSISRRFTGTPLKRGVNEKDFRRRRIPSCAPRRPSPLQAAALLTCCGHVEEIAAPVVAGSAGCRLPGHFHQSHSADPVPECEQSLSGDRKSTRLNS